MPGPLNPAAADPNARGGQYVTTPGFASPGHSTPTNTRTAPDSTVVYSPKGWRWEEAGDDYQKTVSKLTAAAIEGAVRRMRTSFGQVFYIKGTADDRPPFDGETFGDTCRVQDAVTLDIVAEWRWNGSTWERMRVTSEQISNLDVGRLTAGSANISEIAARKIASDVGRFLELTTDQLTVTGNASFTDVVARNIWTRIITSSEGEFEKIRAGMLAANSITSDNIQAGAIDGQVITGATIQTSRTPNRGLHINSEGMEVFDRFGTRTMRISSHTGSIEIAGRLGRSDTWSETYFNDITWDTTGTDYDAQGWRAGVGLAFLPRTDAEWREGAIFLVSSNTHTPEIRIQSPWKQRATRGHPSSIRVTPEEIRLVTFGSGSTGESEFGALNLERTAASIQVRNVVMRVGENDMGFTSGGKVLCGVYSNNASLYVSPVSRIGFYANGTQIGMTFNGKGYWANAEGTHMSGNKKFVMRVPRMTKEKGGLWLSHSCTESPYDGIEYWENVEIGSDGSARWELPDYVPLIASEKAPWVVFTGAEGSSAALDRSNASLWVVNVKGAPGSVVPVLVKGARKIDLEVDEAGEPVMRDFARESMWVLPPQIPDAGGLDVPDPASGVVSQETHLGGGYYGPAPLQKEDQ